MTSLSKEQLAVVASRAERTIVLAGAGSGKTRTVAARIQYLVDHDVSEQDIMAISFTRKSGRELQERLGKLRNVICGTLHSVSLDICSRYESDIRVISEDESLALVTQCGRTCGLCDSNGTWTTRNTYWWEEQINLCRCGVKIDNDDVQKMMLAYESKLRAGGDADYLELLIRAHKYIRQGALANIRHIFVDEAQDIDALQWRIIEDVIKFGKNCKTTIVADLRQSIYSFRGARPDILAGMAGRRFLLADCYRCPPGVVISANNLISKNPEGDARMVAMNPNGEPPIVTQNSVMDIVNELFDLAYGPGDIAILCRTNKQVNETIALLNSRSIPTFRPVKKSRESLLSSILSFGKRPTSAAAYGRMADLVREQLGFKVPPQSNCIIYMMNSSDERMASIGIAMDMCQNSRTVVGEVLPLLRDHMFTEIKEWEKYAGRTITYALNDLELTESEAKNQVSVMTIHQAKGLEFPAVIVPFMEFGKFPHFASLKDTEKMEDERRLFYVAITRPTERLYVQYEKKPSPFIGEMNVPAKTSGYNVEVPFFG